MNQFLAEKVALKAAAPVDMNTAAITGPRIKLDKGFRLAFLVSMGTSVAATVEFTLKQHNAAVGGTTKDLAVANPYFVKAGAATTFTKVEPTAAAALYALPAFAADAGIVVLEVLAEDLDVTNGFGWVSLDVADSGAAKLMSVITAVHEVKTAPAYTIAM